MIESNSGILLQSLLQNLSGFPIKEQLQNVVLYDFYSHAKSWACVLNFGVFCSTCLSEEKSPEEKCLHHCIICRETSNQIWGSSGQRSWGSVDIELFSTWYSICLVKLWKSVKERLLLPIWGVKADSFRPIRYSELLRVKVSFNVLCMSDQSDWSSIDLNRELIFILFVQVFEDDQHGASWTQLLWSYGRHWHQAARVSHCSIFVSPS